MVTSVDKQEVTWAAIRRVRERWAADHSRVAKGGEYALAGFDYQFMVVLRDAVRGWLNNDHSRRREPAVFTEILSDVIAVATNGPVHVTQVKRTQSGPAVRAALDELWLIHKLIFAFEPVLLGVIEYWIVSARAKIADVTSVVSRWMPSDVDENNIELQSFKLSLHIRIDSDPQSELLTLLANEFLADDPLDVMHSWLGRLTHAASTPDGFVSAGREIWNDLNGLSAASEHNRGRSSIYVWQQRDHPPEAVSLGSYLTGERPTPRHLRLGFFARRDTVLEPVCKKLLAWLTPHPASTDNSLRLPVFWIGGRSGTGKSVALLHVLSRVQQEQIGPVLWLGPHIAALADAIRWGQRLRRPGETVVIGLDDPYAPAVQNEAIALWQQAISEINVVRQDDDPMNLPVLVCCGPTEQAERLERELADDVCLMREDLPHENSADRGALMDWFRQRTGKEPPETGDGDVLLVQLFFEWKVGATLPEFANRLRLRIEAADKGDLAGELIVQFSRILALNRLYVGYPSRTVEATLTPTQKSMFLRLQYDNHLVVDPDDARPGMWLAHPHLSNAIYTAWYSGAADQPIRRDHLREGILCAIEYGDSPSQQQSALWAISRALDSTLADSNVADRLAREDLPSLLKEIHRTLIARRAGRLPQTHLPVWIEIRSLCADLELHPDPIEAGIAALYAATPEAGLRLTAHKLLQHLPRHPEHLRTRITQATVHLLDNTTGWREWIPIMLDALRRCRRPELGPILVRWVEEHASHTIVPILLKAGLEHAPGTEVRNLAFRLIATAGEGVAWGKAALMLLRETVTSVPAEIATWAGRHSSTYGACYVLGHLLTLQFAPAIPWSIEWARRFHLERNANWILEPLMLSGEQILDVAEWVEAWIQVEHPNAGRLIQLLLKVQPENTPLRERAIDWLRRMQSSDGSWSYAWEGLWRLSRGDTELVTLGTSWLEASLEQNAWTFVWEALNKRNSGDEQLRELGRRWLEMSPIEHGSWPFVWEALSKRNSDDEQLRELGLRWLEMTPLEHGSWPFVWRALDKATPGDARLRDLGRRWLGTVSLDYGSWPFVWRALDIATPSDDQMRELGQRWLATATLDDGLWPFVWQALDKATPGDEQLRELGLRWLTKAAFAEKSWAFVWLALDKATRGDPQLRHLGLRWLTASSLDHGSWGFLWLALDKATPGDPQLRQLGVHWLESVVPSQKSWQYVWTALDNANPGDAQLRELRLRWLAETPLDHGSWPFVWLAREKAMPGDAQLHELGRRWLAAASLDHKSWTFVWEALNKHDPGDAQLRDRALHWLAKSSFDHRSWPFLWRALDNDTPGDAQLRELGLRWLATAPVDHGSWSFLWLALDKATPGDAQLREFGVRWLATVLPSHGSWGYVWKELDDASPNDEQLRDLAVRWLDVAIEHKSWSFVWMTLWNRSPKNDELSRLGHYFLQNTPRDHFRRWIVESALGVQTSRAHPMPLSADSPVMWIDEWENGGDRATLFPVGMKWLQTSMAHRLWASVFIRLWKAEDRLGTLHQLGTRWLEAYPDGRRADEVRNLLLQELARTTLREQK